VANSNVDLIRQAFHAQAEGDLGPAQELIAGDAVIHVPDTLEQGDLRGIDGMAKLILDLLGRSDGPFATSLVDAIGIGDIVTTLNEVTATPPAMAKLLATTLCGPFGSMAPRS
jgi:hypothetical protein